MLSFRALLPFNWDTVTISVSGGCGTLIRFIHSLLSSGTAWPAGRRFQISPHHRFRRNLAIFLRSICLPHRIILSPPITYNCNNHCNGWIRISDPTASCCVETFSTRAVFSRYKGSLGRSSAGGILETREGVEVACARLEARRALT